MNKLSWLIRWAWVAVVVIALALSNWSLAVVAHHYGLPYLRPLPLAWLLSIPFDCAALVAGDLTLKYARELGSNGAAPRATVFALAGLSAWLNSEHASFLHLGIPAHVMYACPPLVSIVLFELHTHFAYRTALQAAHRTVEPLPVFGVGVWLWHAVQAAKAVSAITGRRLSTRASVELTRLSSAAQIQQANQAAEVAANDARIVATAERRELDGLSKAEAIGRAFRVLGLTAAVPDVDNWLKVRGVEVERSYISAVRTKMIGEIDVPGIEDASVVVSSVQPALSAPKSDSAIVSAGQATQQQNGQVPPAELTDSVAFKANAQPGETVILNCAHTYTPDKLLHLGESVWCSECQAMVPFPGKFFVSADS
jgi:hypothetical protein